jgi:hypothetical protein
MRRSLHRNLVRADAAIPPSLPRINGHQEQGVEERFGPANVPVLAY